MTTTHAHDGHTPIEDREELTYYEKRTWAIQALLVEKGILTAEEIRRQIESRRGADPRRWGQSDRQSLGRPRVQGAPAA